jgi:preprotein translocase subunit SecG
MDQDQIKFLVYRQLKTQDAILFLKITTAVLVTLFIGLIITIILIF